MKKTVGLKKYLAGFIIGLSLVGSVSYAANSGSIGSLFTAGGPGGYHLNGIHITDNSIDGVKFLDNSVTVNKIAKNAVGNSEIVNTDDFTMNGLVLSDIKLTRLYNNGLSVDSTNETQSSIIFRSNKGSTVSGQVAATSLSIGFLKPNTSKSGGFDWLLKINKTTGNIGVGGLEPATTGPNKSVTAGAFFYSSDRRLKENISTLDNSLEKVQKLRGVSFDWKKNGSKDLGLIAQEVEEVYPELVGTDSKGMKSVKYANLVGVLIEAVKEQQTQIEELKVKVSSLEK